MTMNIHDSRKNLRVKDDKRVQWHLDNEDLKREARIRNISTTGMLMETEVADSLKDNSIVKFDRDQTQIDYLPQSGRLIWHKRSRFSKNRYLCGIEFVEPQEDIMSNLRQRIQSGIIRFTNARRIQGLVSALLFVGVIALTVFSIWLSSVIYQGISSTNDKMLKVTDHQASLTRNYIKKYGETQVVLGETKQELDRTGKELISTKGQLGTVSTDLAQARQALQETEALLAQVKTENSKLTELKDINEKVSNEYKTNLDQLDKKNAQLVYEMGILQNQLSFYAGDVADLKEAGDLIKVFKQRMRLVKKKMRGFRKEARKAKVAAFRERDRARSLLGNNGYFVRNGENVQVDMEKYRAAQEDSLNRNVNISVDVFNR